MTHVQTTAKLTHLNIKPTSPMIPVFQICVVNDLKSCLFCMCATHKTNSFSNELKQFVVVHAFLPLKPTSKLDKYNESTFFHTYMSSSLRSCWGPVWLVILIAIQKVQKKFKKNRLCIRYLAHSDRYIKEDCFSVLFLS